MTFNPIRTMLTLTVEVAEALLHLVDFNEAADELWYSDRLVEKETKEEVAKPGRGGGNDVSQGAEPSSGAHGWLADSRDQLCFYCGHPKPYHSSYCALRSSSAASPSAAADEPPSCSASNQGVEQEGLQLTPDDLKDASRAAYYYAGRCTTDTAEARWRRLGHKLLDAAGAN